MNNVKKRKNHELVLAIDPTPRGFGYAILEGPTNPLDWGVSDIRLQVSKRSLTRIKKLIKYYSPDVLVVEDCHGKKSHRSKRVETLIEDITSYARLNRVKVAQYSRGTINQVFKELAGAKNKHQMAERISEFLPVLARQLPPKRKIWESEDPRMNIFDAVAMALTRYYLTS